MQNKIKINNPQKAELQIAALLFLYSFSGHAYGNISFNEPAAYGLGKESAMTKQYAETGTNEERSQVCARLPLQIQLFAEEPGEAGADTDTAGLCDCRCGEKSGRLHFGSCKAFISVARMIA